MQMKMERIQAEMERLQSKTEDTMTKPRSTENADCSASRYDLHVGQSVLLKCEVARLGDNCVVSVKPDGMDFPSAWFNVHRNSIVVADRLVRPDRIFWDNRPYEWDENEEAYFGREGSC